jgi:hypothetical protein
MKEILIILLTIICLTVYSQPKQKEVCHVTHCSGIIRKQGNIILKINDTIALSNLCSLKFETKEAYVAIFSYTYGCIKIGEKEAIRLYPYKNNLSGLVAELLSIKGTTVPLYSRGDCKCLNLNSCFSTDALLNNKVLVFDSVMFQIDPAICPGNENCRYFIQFFANQKKFSRILKMENGIVTIKKSDFFYNDSIYFDFETPASIGIIKSSKGKNQVQAVCDVRFNFCDSKEVYNYFFVLQNLMRGYSPGDIYDEFTRSVYSIYGKPDLCSLNKLINR